jgi:hypothetical protein
MNKRALLAVLGATAVVAVAVQAVPGSAVDRCVTVVVSTDPTGTRGIDGCAGSMPDFCVTATATLVAGEVEVNVCDP